MKTLIKSMQLEEATIQLTIKNQSTSESCLSFHIKEFQLHEDI